MGGSMNEDMWDWEPLTERPDFIALAGEYMAE